jgi:hypothetical protein
MLLEPVTLLAPLLPPLLYVIVLPSFVLAIGLD